MKNECLIYLVEIDAHSKYARNFHRKKTWQSNVFSTYDKAYNWGRIEILRRIEKLKEELGFYHRAVKKEQELEEFVFSELDYNFTISAYNPEKYEDFLIASEQERQEKLKMTRAQFSVYYKEKSELEDRYNKSVFSLNETVIRTYIFDYLGNVIDGTRFSGIGKILEFRIDDEADDAGTKFKVGDIVVYGKEGRYTPKKSERLGVVKEAPGKKEFNAWSNHYWVVGADGFYENTQIHESELKPYEGKPIGSGFLSFLRQVFIGKIVLSDEDTEALERDRIVLNDNQTWREKLKKYEQKR